jgi:hypothetical protein
MTRRTRGAAVLVSALLAGRTWPAPADAAALITNPTAESRAEIARVVSQALNRTSVSLSDDVLRRESTLVVEPAHPRALGGAPVSGRETRKPQHFSLVKNAARCVLVHEESGRRFALSGTTCSER